MWPMAPPIDISREEAARRAAEELSKGKYGQLPKWLTDFLNWLFDLLSRLARDTLFPTTPTGGISWGFVIVVALIVALVVFVIWKVGVPRLSGRRRASAEVELDSKSSAAVYADAATAAAAAGDYKTAVRELFRALVRDLETRTIIQTRPARTAFEAAGSAARELPAVRTQLFCGADLFSGVQYGDLPATRESYDSMRAIHTAVLAAADSPIKATL